MSTTFLKQAELLVQRQWYLIDADGVVLGDLAVKVANLLRGKNKPFFTNHHDCGDFVVIINASKIVLTGNKAKQEKWYWHSGYIGGLKSRTGQQLIDQKPDYLIMHAIKGMMPKNNSLSRQLLKKVHIYADSDHKHQAQKLILFNNK